MRSGKKNSSRSEYQSERSEWDRKREERRGVEARRDAQACTAHPGRTLSSALRRRDGAVCAQLRRTHSLITAGITADTW